MQLQSKQLIEMWERSQKRLEELAAEKSHLKARWDFASTLLSQRGYILSQSGRWFYAPQGSLMPDEKITLSDEDFAQLTEAWESANQARAGN
jgi:hypothetical protein